MRFDRPRHGRRQRRDAEGAGDGGDAGPRRRAGRGPRAAWRRGGGVARPVHRHQPGGLSASRAPLRNLGP
ncbi:hypothetical protein CDV49_16145, partial [Haematobacter genomosp. 1]